MLVTNVQSSPSLHFPLWMVKIALRIELEVEPPESNCIIGSLCLNILHRGPQFFFLGSNVELYDWVPDNASLRFEKVVDIGAHLVE